MVLATAPRLEIINRGAWVPEPVDHALRAYNPSSELGKIITTCFDHLPGPMAFDVLDRITSSIVCESALALSVIRGCPECGPLGRILHCTHCREVEGYGIVGRRQVTAHGVLHLVNSMAATASYTVSNFKYHAIGTGSTAEAATDTVLVTELTTEYNPDNTRATGTQVAAASGNNATYQSVATNTLDSGTPAITEHLLENSATKAAETVPTNQGFDRTVFAAINLVGANADGLASTYTWTLNSGG